MGEKVFIDFVYDLSINTLEDSKEMSCNAEYNHNFDDTLYEKINERLETEFNCTVPFLPPMSSKLLPGRVTPICQHHETSTNAYERYDYLRSSGQSTLCDSPCAGMDIYLGLPFLGTHVSNMAYIKVYLKSTVKIKRTVLDYDFTTLVAELGGYVGLLLGISVVNVSLIINNFFAKCLMEKLLKLNICQ